MLYLFLILNSASETQQKTILFECFSNLLISLSTSFSWDLTCSCFKILKPFCASRRKLFLMNGGCGSKDTLVKNRLLSELNAHETCKLTTLKEKVLCIAMGQIKQWQKKYRPWQRAVTLAPGPPVSGLVEHSASLPKGWSCCSFSSFWLLQGTSVAL